MTEMKLKTPEEEAEFIRKRAERYNKTGEAKRALDWICEVARMKEEMRESERTKTKT